MMGKEPDRNLGATKAPRHLARGGAGCAADRRLLGGIVAAGGQPTPNTAAHAFALCGDNEH